MRALWVHNFNPRSQLAGCFMYTALEGLHAAGIDIQVEYLGNLRSPINIARAGLKVQKLAEDFDIVHAQFGSACALTSSFEKKTPKLVSLRGSDWHRYSYNINFSYFHSLISNAMTRFALNKFDMIIAMSNRMKREILKVNPALNVVTLPSPVDLSVFKKIDRESARAALGCPEDNDRWILFTSISSENSVKRLPLAMEAVRLARRKIGGVKLRVAKGVPHEKMPFFIAACDLILCTSTHEGWPNSIKEALACDVPFVSTDVSDLAEIAAVEPACRVCPPDAHELAGNICEVLAMPRPNNLRRFVEPMDVKNSSKKLLGFYRSLFPA